MSAAANLAAPLLHRICRDEGHPSVPDPVDLSSLARSSGPITLSDDVSEAIAASLLTSGVRESDSITMPKFLRAVVRMQSGVASRNKGYTRLHDLLVDIRALCSLRVSLLLEVEEGGLGGLLPIRSEEAAEKLEQIADGWNAITEKHAGSPPSGVSWLDSLKGRRNDRAEIVYAAMNEAIWESFPVWKHGFTIRGVAKLIAPEVYPRNLYSIYESARALLMEGVLIADFSEFNDLLTRSSLICLSPSAYEELIKALDRDGFTEMDQRHFERVLRKNRRGHRFDD